MEIERLRQDELAILNSYKNEVVEKIHKNQNGFFLTDRAVLAHHKIILKETIGKGSYSKVKEAYDFKNSRKIAVKIINCSKAPKDFQEKFLPRELELWPKVAHPNVITMHDYILSSQKIYMILEYANGGDMLTLIQQLNGPLSETDTKFWINQICNAVEYLHQNEISHRDLKLENLLIDSARNIKLCDFGFSKEMSILNELSMTYCGSKAYASPEILLGEPYDPKKADVWAIGVILFIFLTGNMPFKEDKCNQIILNQQRSLKVFCVKGTKISLSAKQLLKSIFTYEWEKRPNITDVIQNEWLQSCLEASKYNLRPRLSRKFYFKS